MILTKLEREIIDHRLEIGDTIAEVLNDEYGFATDAIENIASLLLNRGPAEYETIVSEKLGGDMAKHVLADAVRGSTYLGAAEGNVSPQQLGRIKRAGDSLAIKIAALTEQEVIYPEG